MLLEFWVKTLLLISLICSFQTKKKQSSCLHIAIFSNLDMVYILAYLTPVVFQFL